MTYALAWPLQQALFARLSADTTLAALMAGPPRLFDGPPHASGSQAAPLPYVVLGNDSALPRGDQTIAGAEHRFDLVIHTDQPGFAQGKQLAAAICDALLGAPLTLSRGRVVVLSFLAARTDRGADDQRQITLSFRALLDDH